MMEKNNIKLSVGLKKMTEDLASFKLHDWWLNIVWLRFYSRNFIVKYQNQFFICDVLKLLKQILCVPSVKICDSV